MTNFDRITQSPETLAKLLSVLIECKRCPKRNLCGDDDTCVGKLTEWLEEPEREDCEC